MRIARTKRIRVGIGALILLGGAVAAVLLSLGPGSGPRFQGRTISEWFDVRTGAGGKAAPSAVSFEEVVQGLGTNGVPYYLSVLRRWPPLEMRMAPLLARFGHEVDPIPAEMRMQSAALALIQVATEHTEIAPQIAETARRVSDEYVQRQLAQALAVCGTNGIPYLIELAPKARAYLGGVLQSQADEQTKTNLLHQIDPVLWTNYSTQFQSQTNVSVQTGRADAAFGRGY